MLVVGATDKTGLYKAEGNNIVIVNEEFIEDDELVEITPDAIRLRKKFLNEHERLQYNKRRKAAQQ